ASLRAVAGFPTAKHSVHVSPPDISLRAVTIYLATYRRKIYDGFSPRLLVQGTAVAPKGPGGTTPRGTHMEDCMADDVNRDGVENQIKGLGKEAEGKIRNSVGGLAGD